MNEDEMLQNTYFYENKLNQSIILGWKGKDRVTLDKS